MIPGIVASQLIFGGGGTGLLGTASINFITGVYTVEGDSVTAAEIIDTPSEIDGGGLHIDLSGTPIEILSPLLDILTSPTWTIVLEIEATNLSGNVWLLSFAQMPVGGTNDTMQIGIGDIGFSDELFVYDDNGSGGSRQISSGATTTLGVHRIAISREDTRLSMSIDGDPFVTDTADEAIPLFTAVTFGNFSGDTNGQAAYIRTFDVMAIQPDNVLESLSALEEESGEAVGSAAGFGIAAGVGSSIGGPTAAVGSASALGSAIAASAQVMATVGTAAGLGSASGVAESIISTSLLHFDGADTSTTITDEKGHTWTSVGGAQLDTAQFKFGSASLLLATNYIFGDGSSDFTYGTGDFTIDCWARFNSVAGDQVIYEGRPGVNGAYPLIYKPNTSNILLYYVSSAARITGTTVLTTGTWYHVAVTRSGTSTRLFLNGTQEGSTYTDSTNYLIGANYPRIGADNSGVSAFNGWIDEFRIVKGTAVWTANFTPPTSPYGN